MNKSKILSHILLVAVASAYYRPSCSGVKVLRFNPKTLFDSSAFGFSQITIDTVNCVAYVAGQTAIQQDGVEIQGNTAVDQLTAVRENLERALVSIDAKTEDIAKIGIFIADYNSTRDLNAVVEFGKKLGSPANTLIGVSQLAFPALLAEVDATVNLCPKFIRSLRFRKCEGGTLLA